MLGQGYTLYRANCLARVVKNVKFRFHKTTPKMFF